MPYPRALVNFHQNQLNETDLKGDKSLWVQVESKLLKHRDNVLVCQFFRGQPQLLDDSPQSRLQAALPGEHEPIHKLDKATECDFASWKKSHRQANLTCRAQNSNPDERYSQLLHIYQPATQHELVEETVQVLELERQFFPYQFGQLLLSDILLFKSGQYLHHNYHCFQVQVHLVELPAAVFQKSQFLLTAVWPGVRLPGRHLFRAYQGGRLVLDLGDADRDDRLPPASEGVQQGGSEPTEETKVVLDADPALGLLRAYFDHLLNLLGTGLDVLLLKVVCQTEMVDALSATALHQVEGASQLVLAQGQLRQPLSAQLEPVARLPAEVVELLLEKRNGLPQSLLGRERLPFIHVLLDLINLPGERLQLFVQMRCIKGAQSMRIQTSSLSEEEEQQARRKSDSYQFRQHAGDGGDSPDNTRRVPEDTGQTRVGRLQPIRETYFRLNGLRPGRRYRGDQCQALTTTQGDSRERSTMIFRLIAGSQSTITTEGFVSFIEDFRALCADLIGETGARIAPAVTNLESAYFSKGRSYSCAEFYQIFITEKFQQLYRVVGSLNCVPTTSADSSLLELRVLEFREALLDLKKTVKRHFTKTNTTAKPCKAKFPPTPSLPPLDRLNLEGTDTPRKPQVQNNKLSESIALSESATTLHQSGQSELLDNIERLQKLLKLNSPAKEVKEQPLRKNLIRNSTILKVHKPGSSIQIGSDRWEMMLQIMLHIKASALSVEMTSRQRGLLDFGSTVVTREQAKSGPSYQFIDYARGALYDLRTRLFISNAQYLDSLGPQNVIGSFLSGKLSVLRELGSEGKSGSFFYYSWDSKFMLKTISEREFESLLLILEDYYYYLVNNPQTLLVKIVGIHSIRTHYSVSSKLVHFLIMTNVFQSPCPLLERYDLKGSAYDRYTRHNADSRTTKKDNNFREQRPQGLALQTKLRGRLLRQLQQDSNFLRSHNLIDYSLLLGISYNEEPEDMDCGTLSLKSFRTKDNNLSVQIGVIDFLTEFGLCKTAQYVVKRVALGAGVSAVPPQEYAARFNSFMSTVFSS